MSESNGIVGDVDSVTKECSDIMRRPVQGVEGICCKLSTCELGGIEWDKGLVAL